MKDKNGIEKNCSNCRYYEVCASNEVCEKYVITVKAYEARIADLEKKLTETVKLLSEKSRECGELEAYNEVLQKRVQEFSMELLEYNMKENKDVLERLKEWKE